MEIAHGYAVCSCVDGGRFECAITVAFENADHRTAHHNGHVRDPITVQIAGCQITGKLGRHRVNRRLKSAITVAREHAEPGLCVTRPSHHIQFGITVEISYGDKVGRVAGREILVRLERAIAISQKDADRIMRRRPHG